MKLRFINILGKSYSQTFSSNATVREACEFLSKKIDIPNSLIYLVRPKHFFYSSNENIKTVLKENPKYVLFTRFNHSITDFTNILNNSFIKTISIPKNAMKTFFNFRLIQQISSEELYIYEKYSSVLNNAPDDLQERINEVAQLGYDIKDCEEALRDANFNVGIAIQILVSKHSEEHNNQFFFDPISFSDDDLYDISSDLEVNNNYYTQTNNNDNYANFDSLSDFSSLSSWSNEEEEDEEEKNKVNVNDQNQIKTFRRQNIPQSFKKQFHYHLTLRRKPPSKFKKIKT